jgi:Cap4 SAVED domain
VREGLEDTITIVTNAPVQDITTLFTEYTLPANSIIADVYVLEKSERAKVADFIVRELPDCYISREDVAAQIARSGLKLAEIIGNKIADPGAVMAGDFGEIITLFFLAGNKGDGINKVKKWRFKQDRNKAAPHSDVILMYCADVKSPSDNDYVLCAEAKVKSTPSKSYRPIAAALSGYESDRTGRLARTLAWLREKEIEVGTKESIAFIERFTKANIGVTYGKSHRAVAVIDRDLLDAELLEQLSLPQQNENFKVIVMGIDELKALYEDCFARAPLEAKIG